MSARPPGRGAEPPLLLVHDESPGLGGAITSLGALVPFLRGAGWRVEVAALQDEGWAGEGMEPVLLPRHGDRIDAAAFFVREARRALDLRRLCRRLRPDALLGNNGPLANLATHLAGWSLGVPVHQYVRGPFWESVASRRVLRSAASVLAVGEEVARQVRRASGVAPLQLGEGLDPLRWPTRRGPGARDWLWNSALVAWKGFPLLLRAHAALGADAPLLHACYATFPAGHPEAVALPDALPGRVVARRAPADLDQIRARCLVYVHTALEPEPFGRSVLEAMAAGLCPVVPDAGTPGRLVRHMESGIVYRAGSQAGLEAALRLAARRPELCERLGDEAARVARAHTADAAFRPVLSALERSTPLPGRGTVPIRDENRLTG